jgi:hypothetical protein
MDNLEWITNLSDDELELLYHRMENVVSERLGQYRCIRCGCRFKTREEVITCYMSCTKIAERLEAGLGHKI